jgi:hypothetical protein
LIRKRKEIIRRTKPRDAEPDTRHYEGERGSFVSLTVPSLNHWRPHFTGAIVFLFVPFFPWLSTCIACVIHIRKSILVQVIIEFHSKNSHCNQNKIVKLRWLLFRKHFNNLYFRALYIISMFVDVLSW